MHVPLLSGLSGPGLKVGFCDDCTRAGGWRWSIVSGPPGGSSGMEDWRATLGERDFNLIEVPGYEGFREERCGLFTDFAWDEAAR